MLRHACEHATVMLQHVNFPCIITKDKMTNAHAGLARRCSYEFFHLAVIPRLSRVSYKHRLQLYANLSSCSLHKVRYLSAVSIIWKVGEVCENPSESLRSH